MHSKVNWVYCIWVPSKDTPDIPAENLVAIHKHIRAFAEEKGIVIDSANWFQGEFRVLFALAPEQTIDKVALQIQGESQYWINQQKFLVSRFEWDSSYRSIGVSRSNAERYRQMIQHPEVFQDVPFFDSLNDDWHIFYHETYFG